MAEPEVSHPVSGPNFKNLLNPVALRDIVAGWLKEDVPNFDYGAFVVGEKQETAVLLCKSAGVLAGVPFFNAIFEHLDCHVSWNYLEGVALHPICQVATVTGKAKNILLGERVALNCISRASGVATAASRLRVIAEKAEWHGEIAATRKTTPGFRMVEKYSVLVGGLSQHRYDLSSMVMLKDNHIWSAGSITQAVKEARRVCGFSMKIEVECLDVTDAFEAARAGADIVMLDNVGPQKLHEDAACLKAEFPRLCVEASGGVTEDNVRRYMGPHVDVISLGRLTQGYECVDFSLKVVNENTKSPHLRTTV